jgi:hypothetical protein
MPVMLLFLVNLSYTYTYVIRGILGFLQGSLCFTSSICYIWANCLKFAYFITTINLRFSAILKAILIEELKTDANYKLRQKINLRRLKWSLPVTVAERSNAWTVFARSDAVIVGSNPTRGMDVYMLVRFSVFVLSCV